MIDRERILAKLADLDGYLNELSQIAPSSFDEYVRSIEKRRAGKRKSVGRVKRARKNEQIVINQWY